MEKKAAEVFKTQTKFFLFSVVNIWDSEAAQDHSQSLCFSRGKKTLQCLVFLCVLLVFCITKNKPLLPFSLSISLLFSLVFPDPSLSLTLPLSLLMPKCVQQRPHTANMLLLMLLLMLLVAVWKGRRPGRGWTVEKGRWGGKNSRNSRSDWRCEEIERRWEDNKKDKNKTKNCKESKLIAMDWQ